MLHWLIHALRRRSLKAALASNAQPPQADQLVGHIIALEAVGWRIAELRPSTAGDERPLWRVSITRFDLNASMSASAVAPEDALAELLHYASPTPKGSTDVAEPSNGPIQPRRVPCDVIGAELTAMKSGPTGGTPREGVKIH